MGIMGKLSGVDKMSAVRDQKLSQIASQFASGRTEASVLLTQEEIGTRFRMDTFSSFLCREFEKAGYQVIGVTDPGWSYKMTITVIR
jgi:hypothetical protein